MQSSSHENYSMCKRTRLDEDDNFVQGKTYNDNHRATHDPSKLSREDNENGEEDEDEEGYGNRCHDGSPRRLGRFSDDDEDGCTDIEVDGSDDDNGDVREMKIRTCHEKEEQKSEGTIIWNVV